MLTHVKRLWTGQEGQGLAEYGLILALVAIAVIVALGNLGTNISGKVDDIATEIGNASTTTP